MKRDPEQTFVDGAFALAVSLLVIPVTSPPRDVAGLQGAMRTIPASLLAFFLVAMFWWAQARWYRRYELHDGYAVLLRLALVFLVLVYVFPLRLISASFVAWVSRGALASEASATLGKQPAELRWLFAGMPSRSGRCAS